MGYMRILLYLYLKPHSIYLRETIYCGLAHKDPVIIASTCRPQANRSTRVYGLRFRV